MKTKRLSKAEMKSPLGFLLHVPGNLRKEAPTPTYHPHRLSSEPCALNCVRYLILCNVLFSQESAGSLFSYFLPCLTLRLIPGTILAIALVLPDNGSNLSVPSCARLDKPYF